MLEQAAHRMDASAFVLGLAQSIRLGHLGLVGYLLASCETLGTAAETLQRYAPLINGINIAEFDTSYARCTLTWRAPTKNPHVEFTLLSMALWVHQARWLSNRPDLVCDVAFTFPRPASAAMLSGIQHVFRGKVSFDAPLSQMAFSKEYLDLPVISRDRHVHATLRRQAEADLAPLIGIDREFVSDH